MSKGYHTVAWSAQYERTLSNYSLRLYLAPHLSVRYKQRKKLIFFISYQNNISLEALLLLLVIGGYNS